MRGKLFCQLQVIFEFLLFGLVFVLFLLDGDLDLLVLPLL